MLHKIEHAHSFLKRNKVHGFCSAGELEIARAHSVLKFNPMAGHEGGSGAIGALFVTNFKVSFVTPAPSAHLKVTLLTHSY